jgi:hypothetical protein
MKIYSVLSFTAVKFKLLDNCMLVFSIYRFEIDYIHPPPPQKKVSSAPIFQISDSRRPFPSRVSGFLTNNDLVVADCELPTGEHGTLFLPTLGTVLANQN